MGDNEFAVCYSVHAYSNRNPSHCPCYLSLWWINVLKFRDFVLLLEHIKCGQVSCRDLSFSSDRRNYIWINKNKLLLKNIYDLLGIFDLI